jgi:hypothetical protein
MYKLPMTGLSDNPRNSFPKPFQLTKECKAIEAMNNLQMQIRWRSKAYSQIHKLTSKD